MTLIAAMGRDREIGYQGQMPWHLPRDLKHFKAITLGHTVLMGRKTWEALPFALPGRRNVIITRQHDYRPQVKPEADVHIAHSVEMACELAGNGEIMIIGGAQLYSICLPWASVLELTLIDVNTLADTWFPDWNLGGVKWTEISREQHPTDENNAYAMTFVRLQRLVVSETAISG